MAWVKPQYSKRRVDWAGELLIQESPEVDWWELIQAEDVVNNWRSAHSYPLHAIKMTLKSRAKKIDRSSLIAQRLKRLESIKLKLKLSRAAGHHPQLSQMQDIGGCRAVVSSVAQAEALAESFAEATRKAPHRGPQFSKKFDYIAAPKPNGYRNIHLVYKYRTDSEEHSCYNGQRIEIQIRSRLQHSWATAVETYSTFAGEALKSNVGSPKWIRFFALVSSAFALRERRPLVPDTPHDEKELKEELRNVANELRALQVLDGWSGVQPFVAQETIPQEVREADLYLLALNPQAESVTLWAYSNSQMAQANQHYAALEKENPQWQTVLVSVDSVNELRAAYPNYYLDTSVFVRDVRAAME